MARLSDTGYAVYGCRYVRMTDLVGRVVTIRGAVERETKYGPTIEFDLEVDGEKLVSFLSPDEARSKIVSYFTSSNEPLRGVRIERFGRYIGFVDDDAKQISLLTGVEGGV